LDLEIQGKNEKLTLLKNLDELMKQLQNIKKNLRKSK
jgi:hypothetical protein